MSEQAHDKPSLLMLSHCVPQAHGRAARARAWQLLQTFAHSHRVFLLTLADGPIHLRHWRAIHQLACGFVLRRHPWSLTAPVRNTAELWEHQESFHAALVTHPSLWHAIQDVEAEYQLCDLALPRSCVHERLASLKRGLTRWWHARRAAHWRNLELHVSRHCDALLFCRQEDAHPFLGSGCQTFVLPPRVEPAPASHPRLAPPTAPPTDVLAQLGFTPSTPFRQAA